MIHLGRLTKRSRLILEESWYHELPEVRNPDRRWYEIIPCQGFKKAPGQEGPFIRLYSEDPPLLKLYSNRPQNFRTIWEAIKGHPGTRADFGFHLEADLYFPPELLERVGEMAGARKRRVLSAEQRARLYEVGKAGREAFLKRKKSGVQTRIAAQGEAIPAGARGK